MTDSRQSYNCILGIATTTRGLGFALLERERGLVAWGGKTSRGDKNAAGLRHAQALITRYQPDIVVLEDVSAEKSRRSPRIKTLVPQIIDLVKLHKIKAIAISPEQVKAAFSTNGFSTKHARAEQLAKHFPVLADYVPPKRSAWMSEDANMGIFDALALASAYHFKKLS
jgi:Holliday junction resolvasome RuvABC endonuclease subunit